MNAKYYDYLPHPAEPAYEQKPSWLELIANMYRNRRRKLVKLSE